MKFRNWFVSNSSTTSFALGKFYMSPKQIEDFREFIDELDDDDLEGYICETDLYFQGEVDQDTTVIEKWLRRNKLEKYAGFAH